MSATTADKPVKQPGPAHPISIEPGPARVIVRAGGRTIADTTGALSLREAAYGPVLYIPRADADMSLLQRTARHTYCPYKGDCSYFSIPATGEAGTNAVWTYEAPFPAVAAIEGYLAFYADRVQIEETPRAA